MWSVWDMILQWGSTVKVSIEIPVATRHRRDITEKLLKATLNLNTYIWQVESILLKILIIAGLNHIESKLF